MLASLILLRPVRKLLQKPWYQPEEGAGQDKTKNSWFEHRDTENCNQRNYTMRLDSTPKSALIMTLFSNKS